MLLIDGLIQMRNVFWSHKLRIENFFEDECATERASVQMDR